MTSAFDHMAKQLAPRCWPNDKVNIVLIADYELFCKEYVFDQLRGVSFGESFCRKFYITDFVLSILSNEQSAKRHIETIGYIKNDISGY